jgi:hypothetical protein
MTILKSLNNLKPFYPSPINNPNYYNKLLNYPRLSLFLHSLFYSIYSSQKPPKSSYLAPSLKDSNYLDSLHSSPHPSLLKYDKLLTSNKKLLYVKESIRLYPKYSQKPHNSKVLYIRKRKGKYK